MIITEQALCELLEFEAKATKGPWRTFPDLPTLVEQDNHRTVASCSTESQQKHGTADAQFIAQSRNLLPDLVREYMAAVESQEETARLLGEAVTAVMYISGPSHQLALEIREHLAEVQQRIAAYRREG